MKRIYVKWYGPEWDKEQWHWKLLCWVPDNEALGVMESALKAAGQEVLVKEGQEDD